MSEVIEEFIRRHPGATEGEAFEEFLDQPRIRAWVGDDASRKERLHREFARVWSGMRGGGATAQTRTIVQPQPPEQTPVQAPPAPRVQVRPAQATTGRRLQLLCPSCTRVDVWLDGGMLTCRSCGTVYDDMLALVPVKAVGPFEYLFGEGTKGALTAVGVGLLLLGVYGVLKWL